MEKAKNVKKKKRYIPEGFKLMDIMRITISDATRRNWLAEKLLHTAK